MNIKKILVGALTGALLFLSAHFAFAAGLTDVQTPPTDVLKKANDFAARISGLPYDFFTETNDSGDALRYGDLILPHEGTVNYLAWGPWHSDSRWDGEGATKKDRNNIDRARYIGYSYYGEQVSNVFFPPDRSGEWKPFNSNGIVEKPWNDAAVRQAFPQFFGPSYGFDDKTDPDLIQAMQLGLDYCALSNEFTPPDPNSDLYQNPQKYLHVFLPPSEQTFGMGVIFSRDPGGSLWYRSVPLTDLNRTKFNPDDAISLDPPERTGNPGDPATFALKVSWQDMKAVREIADEFGFDFGFLIQVSHQVNGSPNAAAFTMDGMQSQDAGNGWAQIDYTDLSNASKTGSVTVHVQDVPSEVVAQIVPYVKDRESGYVFLWTDCYLYKQAKAKVTPDNLLKPEPQITTGPGLHFQAISQRNAVTGQDTDPPREPDTARWTDTVTATLSPLRVQTVVNRNDSVDYSVTVAPPPPPGGGCEPAYTTLDSWRLNSATLTYPKQNPHYTFGDPRPPIGVEPNDSGQPIPLSSSGGIETASMTPASDGHALTCQFKEMWAENGTYLHDILNPSLDSWIQTPQTYKLTASSIQVKVNYTVHTFHLVCDPDGGCSCVESTSPGSYTYTLNPISGNLLVNGTGVASIGM